LWYVTAPAVVTRTSDVAGVNVIPAACHAVLTIFTSRIGARE
jgi:hypothetical protein